MTAGRRADKQLNPEDALWTFNMNTEAWRQQTVTGDVPVPNDACALTVSGDHAYLLMVEDEQEAGLQIYELDLQR